MLHRGSPQPTFTSKYEEIRVIKKGDYGTTVLVRARKERRLYVAKKVVYNNMSQKEREAALQEVRLLQELKHPNIVTYHESFFEDHQLILITDYCEDGDLSVQIKKQKEHPDGPKPFPEKVIMNWLLQILFALDYIHSKRIMHRDLKVTNIYLDKSTVKIGDFAVCKVLDDTHSGAATLVGTPYYFSPEQCENKTYTFKSDMWALGCVVYELCTLKRPFEARSLIELVVKIVRDQPEGIPKIYSGNMKMLVDRLLSKNPHMRPSIREVLAEKYMLDTMRDFIKSKGTVGDSTTLGIAQEGLKFVGKTSSTAANKPQQQQSTETTSKPTGAAGRYANVATGFEKKSVPSQDSVKSPVGSPTQPGGTGGGVVVISKDGKKLTPLTSKKEGGTTPMSADQVKKVSGDKLSKITLVKDRTPQAHSNVPSKEEFLKLGQAQNTQNVVAAGRIQSAGTSRKDVVVKPEKQPNLLEALLAHNHRPGRNLTIPKEEEGKDSNRSLDESRESQDKGHSLRKLTPDRKKNNFLAPITNPPANAPDVQTHQHHLNHFQLATKGQPVRLKSPKLSPQPTEPVTEVQKTPEKEPTPKGQSKPIEFLPSKEQQQQPAQVKREKSAEKAVKRVDSMDNETKLLESYFDHANLINSQEIKLPGFEKQNSNTLEVPKELDSQKSLGAGGGLIASSLMKGNESQMSYNLSLSNESVFARTMKSTFSSQFMSKNFAHPGSQELTDNLQVEEITAETSKSIVLEKRSSQAAGERHGDQEFGENPLVKGLNNDESVHEEDPFHIQRRDEGDTFDEADREQKEEENLQEVLEIYKSQLMVSEKFAENPAEWQAHLETLEPIKEAESSQESVQKMRLHKYN